MKQLVDDLVRLLTGRPRPMFGPPILAEVTIIVDRDGRGQLFSPKFLDEGDPKVLITVASSIVRTGIWFAESRGLHLRIGEGGQVSEH